MKVIRKAYVENLKTLADAGTETIDIMVAKPITKLDVIFRADNDPLGNHSNWLIDKIKKVELVDGSDVLYSASGVEGQAMGYYSSKQIPFSLNDEIGAWEQILSIPILFGREEGDSEYYLDPAKFANLQLKVTWDIGTTTPAAIDQFKANSLRMTIIATIIAEGAEVEKGFLMTKAIASWTSAGAGDYRIDLPVDFPIRKIMMRGYKLDLEPNFCISDLKLSCDNDALIPFDLKWLDISRDMIGRYGLASERFQYNVQNADTFFHHLPFNTVVSPSPEADKVIVGIVAPQGGRGQILMNDDAGAAIVVDKSVICNILGTDYHHTCCYDFGRSNVPDDWFDPTEYGSVRLIATQVAAGVTASVLLQQLRAA